MEPCPHALRCGIAARHSRAGARRSTSSTRCHASSSRSATGPSRCDTAALFTRIVSAPNSSSAVSTRCCGCAGLHEIAVDEHASAGACPCDLAPPLLVPTGDHHVRAFRGEAGGDRPSNAGCRARHQCHVAVQPPQVHSSCLRGGYAPRPHCRPARWRSLGRRIRSQCSLMPPWGLRPQTPLPSGSLALARARNPDTYVRPLPCSGRSGHHQGVPYRSRYVDSATGRRRGGPSGRAGRPSGTIAIGVRCSGRSSRLRNSSPP